MTQTSILLLLLVAIAIGWLLGRYHRFQSRAQERAVAEGYVKGLNYLVNEQPDEAIEAFIQALQIKSETVETHLALGSLFRRRGEVDRAIRIHQNLLDQWGADRNSHSRKINPQLRERVLLALGRDYLAAGLLDRAERTLEELVQPGKPFQREALEHLQQLYEQERDWERAIRIAENLLEMGQKKVAGPLAHYHCELAEAAVARGDYDGARIRLRRALGYDATCVRASLLLGQLEFQAGRIEEAIQSLKRVQRQDPAYVTESMAPLGACYDRIGKERDFLQYLQLCVEEYPMASVVLTLAERLKQLDGEEKGIELITQYLRKYPSVKGLKRLIDLQWESRTGEFDESLTLLRQLTEQWLSHKPAYHCHHCGFAGKSLHWRCPSCKTWGTIKPIKGAEGE